MSSGAGLSGVIVGAVLSLIGSLVVARRAVVREMRVRIYEDLLPPLSKVLGRRESKALDRYAEPSRELLEPIVRAGHVAGGADAGKVDELNATLERWENMLDKTTTEFDEDRGQTILVFNDEVTEDEYVSAVDGFRKAVGDYREWLREKLNGWL